jgi:hypothetical protein
MSTRAEAFDRWLRTSFIEMNTALEELYPFLDVCDLFGRTAAQHHDQLVSRFIEGPARALPEDRLHGITASGPPLPVLVRSLEVLRDYRIAAPRPDLETRHADLARLRAAVDA